MAKNNKRQDTPKKRKFIPDWINIPFILVIAATIVLLFVQENNIFTIYENEKEIQALKKEIQANIDTTNYYRYKKNELNTSREELERIAREQYQMKRTSEDIYLVDEE